MFNYRTFTFYGSVFQHFHLYLPHITSAALPSRVKLFAQPVRRCGKPSWATANDEQIMHSCLPCVGSPERVPTT
jgi:hypothetical protein